MKTYLFLSIFTITSTVYCTEMNLKDYTTKLVEVVMVQWDNTSASAVNDNYKIDIEPTILEDGSIKTKLVIWERN